MYSYFFRPLYAAISEEDSYSNGGSDDTGEVVHRQKHMTSFLSVSTGRSYTSRTKPAGRFHTFTSPRWTIGWQHSSQSFGDVNVTVWLPMNSMRNVLDEL